MRQVVWQEERLESERRYVIKNGQPKKLIFLSKEALAL